MEWKVSQVKQKWRCLTRWLPLKTRNSDCSMNTVPGVSRWRRSLTFPQSLTSRHTRQVEKRGCLEKITGRQKRVKKQERVQAKEWAELGVIVETKPAWVWILPGPLWGHLTLDTFDFSKLCCLHLQATNTNRVIFTRNMQWLHEAIHAVCHSRKFPGSL